MLKNLNDNEYHDGGNNVISKIQISNFDTLANRQMSYQRLKKTTIVLQISDLVSKMGQIKTKYCEGLSHFYFLHFLMVHEFC